MLAANKDIEKISLEILRGSKSLDVFPTPVSKIVEYSELVVSNDIDVSKIHHGYFEKAGETLKRALSKVRGIFDRREKTIYLDLSQKINRKNFIQLHEVGHGVLPWQKKIHDILADDDQTLDPDANEEFEAEANYFASITLFQHDRFNHEQAKLGLGIDAAIQLGKHFGASIHASLRRFIQCSKNRCALIILEKLNSQGDPYCSLKNFISSQNFMRDFGFIQLPVTLGLNYPFVEDYFCRRKFRKDGIITLPTKNGEVQFNYQFFNNTYNAFVFLYPVGEVKKTKVTIYMSEGSSMQ